MRGVLFNFIAIAGQNNHAPIHTTNQKECTFDGIILRESPVPEWSLSTDDEPAKLEAIDAIKRRQYVTGVVDNEKDTWTQNEEVIIVKFTPFPGARIQVTLRPQDLAWPCNIISKCQYAPPNGGTVLEPGEAEYLPTLPPVQCFFLSSATGEWNEADHDMDAYPSILDQSIIIHDNKRVVQTTYIRVYITPSKFQRIHDLAMTRTSKELFTSFYSNVLSEEFSKRAHAQQCEAPRNLKWDEYKAEMIQSGKWTQSASYAKEQQCVDHHFRIEQQEQRNAENLMKRELLGGSVQRRVK